MWSIHKSQGNPVIPLKLFGKIPNTLHTGIFIYKELFFPIKGVYMTNRILNIILYMRCFVTNWRYLLAVTTVDNSCTINSRPNARYLYEICFEIPWWLQMESREKQNVLLLSLLNKPCGDTGSCIYLQRVLRDICQTCCTKTWSKLAIGTIIKNQLTNSKGRTIGKCIAVKDLQIWPRIPKNLSCLSH